MKKVLVLVFLSLKLCNTGFAESYYFKECKINEKIFTSYSINLSKSEVQVSIKKNDELVQELTDKIQLVTKDQITSKIIKSASGKDNYFQYYLNANSKSVTKQIYKKEGGFYKLSGPIRQSYCSDVKADWDKNKNENKKISKNQELISETQKKLLKKQSSLTKCQGGTHDKWTNCQGAYIAQDGIKYIGQFKDGKILEGTAIYPGGAKYIGKFNLNKPNGQGTFLYSDGSKHFGEWKDGKGHGQGIKTWQDGKEYAGAFKNDKPHGEGTFKYPDGSKYVGEHKDGKRHGQGTLTYSDGRTYIGQFVANLEHGKGLCMNQDGLSIDCKILKMENKTDSSGKDRRNISIEAKKWIKLSEYESISGKGKKIINKLENDFDARAFELCSSTSNFNILEKKIILLEIDETPAFGLEPKVQLGIDGVVECE